MLETLIITFREGMEAFLVVAIMLAYITKTGHYQLRRPIFAGIAVALIISATTGWHIADLAQDPIWEGSLAIIAGVLVASFTFYIMKTAHTIKAEIGTNIERNVQKDGPLAEIGVFLFTVLMIAREGMETALMLGTISAQNEATQMWLGAAAGLLMVAVIAYLWMSQSQRINLGLFLQVTGIFLVLFSLELFIYGLHELSEMSALPLIGEEMNTEFHIATEVIESSLVSNVITFCLLAVPLGWLGLSFLIEKFGTDRASRA